MQFQKRPLAGSKPPLLTARGLAAESEKFRRGYLDALAGHSLGTEWRGWEYGGGHTAGRMARKEMGGILARMREQHKTEPEFARIEAVDALVLIGLTTPEAWKLVWDAMPVEAEDKLERAVG